jgi:hypothetical protein
MRKPVTERFKKFVDKDGPLFNKALGKCWLWRASVYGNGFGQFDGYGLPNGSRNERQAHRVSWVLFKGQPIPEGHFVLQKCGVRLCVNPEHLYLSTSWKRRGSVTVRATTAVTLPGRHSLVRTPTARGARRNRKSKFWRVCS